MSARTHGLVLGAVMCAWVACAALAQGPAAGGAANGSYEVRRGDTLFAIARRLRPEGVSLHQMVLALYRANPAAFRDGNVNQLAVGAVLAVPDRGAATAVAPAEAARQVAALAAARPEQVAAPVPLPPVAVPAPAPEPAVAALAVPRPPARVPLGREEAERRYREGLAMERAGDERGALQAFLDAGESGHGLAQKRLGEIYDRGNSATLRDYETSLRWYQKAREQGIAVPKPETRAPAIR